MRFNVTKSKRVKKPLVKISPSKKIIIKVPYYYTKENISTFIKHNEKRIKKWIKKQFSQTIFYEKIKFFEGDKIPFMGKFYELVYSYNQNKKLTLKDKFFLDIKYRKSARKIFYKWFKEKAGEILSNKLQYFAQKYKFKYTRLKISYGKSIYGTCSQNQEITLSFRILFFPEDVIDYIIIHELAHTQELNHSQKFWQIVEEIIPDFKEKRKWLKNNRNLTYIF